MASTAAAPPIVTHAADDAPSTDGVFAGLSFFLVQKLPSRSTFVSKIQANGGRVVKLEAQAHHIIADHFRPVNCPPGSISYTFIDKALEKASLPDPADHPAGAPKGTVRPAATSVPTKGTRTPFTQEDDRALYHWVKRHEAKGASVKGNELYKQLEVRNARHTYQAWRDRYIKRLVNQPPPGVDWETVLASEDPQAALDGSLQGPVRQQKQEPAKIVVGDEEFTQDDVERLVLMGGDIEHIVEDRVDEAWEAYADGRPEHSGGSWRRLWDEVARAEFLKRTKIPDEQDVTPQAVNRSVSNEADGQSSTPDRPASSNSLKRKRTTPTPRKKATYGRKKQKEGHELFGEGGSDRDNGLPNGQAEVHTSEAAHAAQLGPQLGLVHNSRHSQSPRMRARPRIADASNDAVNVDQEQSSALPTSEANTTAADQLDKDHQRLLTDKILPSSQRRGRRLQSDRLVADETFTTSEANRAAAMQLDDEYAKMLAEATPHASQEAGITSSAHASQEQANAAPKQPGDSDRTALITSELNREADEQLRQQNRVHRQDEMPEYASDIDPSRVREDKRSNMDSSFQRDDASIHSTRNDTALHSEAIASQIGDDDPSNLVATRGNALTEANLATQDEQHREPLVRGTDLPQDDEMQDQTDFVQYLQNLQRSASGNEHRGPKTGQQNAPSSEDQRPGSSARPGKSNTDTGAGYTDHNHLHDAIFDELPLSSQQELDEIMEEALHWPDSPKLARARKPEQLQEQSKTFGTPIKYPDLPSHQPQEDERSPEQPSSTRSPDLNQRHSQSYEELQARFDREVLGLGPQGSRRSEDDDTSDREDLPVYQRSDQEDEIDLAMPEPEGGFGFSSSQLWPSQQLPEHGDDVDQASAQRRPHASHSREQKQLILDMSEPASGVGFSSSPPRGSQHSLASKVQDRMSQAPATQHAEEVVASASGHNAIEITSSSSSSSSEAGSQPKQHVDMPQDLPRALETQDVYNAETQLPDFDMPSPDVGPTLETQDIYNAETRVPDLDMPLPDGEWDNVSDPPSFPSSPTRPTAQESQAALADTQTLSDDDFTDYMHRMVFIEKYAQDDVVHALQCTSMRAELADLVLLEARHGKGFPTDVPGIWSEEDDQTLEGGNAKALRALEERHGWKECEARMIFLQEWREDEDEEEG